MTAMHVDITGKGIYPRELNIEVVNSNVPVLIIPPLPYAYFVLFLCAHHLNDLPTQLDSLQQFELLVYHKSCGIDLKNITTFIIFNMMGICYELLGDKQRAALYYKQSVNIKYANTIDSPHIKAALIRLQLLEMQEF